MLTKTINKLNFNPYFNKQHHFSLIDNIKIFIKLNNGIDYFGDKCWYKNGKLHRENDKPAIEHSDGGKDWYINGEFIKRNYDEDINIYNDKFFNNDGNEIY